MDSKRLKKLAGLKEAYQYTGSDLYTKLVSVEHDLAATRLMLKQVEDIVKDSQGEFSKAQTDAFKKRTQVLQGHAKTMESILSDYIDFVYKIRQAQQRRGS